MNRYINQGRFGTFVQGFLEAEYERRKAESEKNNEWMLWMAYIHSYSDKSFTEWKKQFSNTDSTTAKKTMDAYLDDAGISRILNNVFGG